ncbi:hypothetical protein ACFQ5N_08390 [Lutibacter holmesii]|uniref:Uncharacterized protein n=1 Tax=Lutibacter holmesii TaxID=1137985 RepID=A0ABW3WP61_9FLAO
MKNLLKYFFLLFLTVSLQNCKKEIQSEKTNHKRIFEGLYNVKYEGYDRNYVWIFSEDKRYVLYSALPGTSLAKENRINYETPLHFFTEEDKLYICGINTAMKAKPLSICKKEDIKPSFRIVSIDTINDIWKYQRIILKEYNSSSNYKTILKKNI